MTDVLARIKAYKEDEVLDLKQSFSTENLFEKAQNSPKPKGFHAALKAAAEKGPALIAEVKKASPSKGLIREDFQPDQIAHSYQAGGAACLSVLTDTPSFQGSAEILQIVRKASDLPILRKDFMIDPMQVYETRAMGADAILLILAMIDDHCAQELIDAAKDMNLDILVETHSETELERALDLPIDLIGINNRDLRTFHTALETFERLAPKVPSGKTLIAESGIFTADDIKRLAKAGAHGYLVGESLMRQTDVREATQQLLSLS